MTVFMSLELSYNIFYWSPSQMQSCTSNQYICILTNHKASAISLLHGAPKGTFSRVILETLFLTASSFKEQWAAQMAPSLNKVLNPQHALFWSFHMLCKLTTHWSITKFFCSYELHLISLLSNKQTQLGMQSMLDWLIQLD